MNEHDDHSSIPDYGSLANEEPPASTLEVKVVSALRNHRLIASDKPSGSWKLLALVAATEEQHALTTCHRVVNAVSRSPVDAQLPGAFPKRLAIA